MIVYVKNMVCNRCIYVVQSLIKRLQLNALTIQLGEIELIEDELTSNQFQILHKN